MNEGGQKVLIKKEINWGVNYKLTAIIDYHLYIIPSQIVNAGLMYYENGNDTK